MVLQQLLFYPKISTWKMKMKYSGIPLVDYLSCTFLSYTFQHLDPDRLPLKISSVIHYAFKFPYENLSYLYILLKMFFSRNNLQKYLTFHLCRAFSLWYDPRWVIYRFSLANNSNRGRFLTSNPKEGYCPLYHYKSLGGCDSFNITVLYNMIFKCFIDLTYQSQKQP